MFGKYGRKWKPSRWLNRNWRNARRNDSSVGEEVFKLSFSGYQQNSMVNVTKWQNRVHGEEWKDKRRARVSEWVSGVKMECVNIPIIGALNSVFFEVWPGYTEQYIHWTNAYSDSQTVRVYSVYSVYSIKNWLFTSGPFSVYCFENVVYRSVYCAMLCNVDSLGLFIQALLRLMLRTDKSHPVCLPACQKYNRAPLQKFHSNTCVL